MALRTGLSIAYRSVMKPSLLQKKNSLCFRSLSGETGEDIKTKIDKMVSNNKVVVFMKGDPQQPRCGFSNAVVQVFETNNWLQSVINPFRSQT